MRDLAWLIDPFPKAAFFETIWQVEPRVLTRGRAGCFKDVFSSAAVERILEFSQPRPPSVRLADQAARSGLEVPFLGSGRIDMEKLRKHYLAGRSIVLNTVEDYDPEVARLARSIETELGARVQANSYLTPAGAQGFNAHYDTHDVLVVQIEGEKRWKIYGGNFVCPLNEMSDGGAASRKDRVEPDELLLVAGDVLYIPRGWIHEAETQDTPSLHLTFGLHPPLGRDLLSAALEDLTARRPELREALPVGALASADRSELTARFDRLLALLVEEADLDAAVAAVDGHMLRRGRSAGDGHLFADMDRLSHLASDTRLARRADVACRLVSLDAGVALQFMNGLVTGPETFREAMVFICHAKDSFQVSALPGLDPDEQLALAMSLVTDGLCRIILADAGSEPHRSSQRLAAQ